MDEPGVYELFQQRHEPARGRATSTPPSVPLSRARDLEPDKASIREALGRALFGAQRYGEAAEEFEAVVEHAPTNDYALFCLGPLAAAAWAATPRRATRSRWRRTCGPSAATTASTATSARRRAA